MKAQHTFGLKLSWLRVTVIFLIDIAILALAKHWPDALGSADRARWPGVGLAVVITAAALITHRRVPLTAAVVARAADRFASPAAALTAGRTAASDHQRRYSREVVGIRQHHGHLVTVIGIETPVSTGRHSGAPTQAAVLPVELVAVGIRQFDVRLDGIDIVSVQTADDPDGEPGASGSHRRTWLILRLDPLRNAGAIAARESVAATLTAATERLAHSLNERRIDARILSADEFADVDAALLAGLQPGRIRRRRRRLKQKEHKGPRQYAATFWVSPRDITSANLERLWLRETDATVVTVRLAAHRNRTTISVLVRFHRASRLRRKAYAGLNRLNGRQLTALRTSMPAPGHRTLALPTRTVDGDETLQVPLAAPAPPAPARVKMPA
ncbi:type VII secretion protein EccE [Mycobacterium sp. M1]|uniref:Type VII secretion protein EccE n=1 Tax=Mycolicibacter acidiphilus TaxID=2835306 RepID=A0ABS5RRG3_9MYCO|nr:type VII secretion protein EccE [Mycolicibacter acidiphilus]MBS9536076.1 type VII secretion protein EccE [Mycolicibacter acidiphilus]